MCALSFRGTVFTDVWTNFSDFAPVKSRRISWQETHRLNTWIFSAAGGKDDMQMQRMTPNVREGMNRKQWKQQEIT